MADIKRLYEGWLDKVDKKKLTEPTVSASSKDTEDITNLSDRLAALASSEKGTQLVIYCAMSALMKVNADHSLIVKLQDVYTAAGGTIHK